MNWKTAAFVLACLLFAATLLWGGEELTSATPAAGVFINTGQSLGNAITYDLTAADLDSDNALDVFEASNSGIRAWLNDGTAAFTSTQTFDGSSSSGVALGDLDGDNTIDAAVGHGSGASIWLNDGAGVFTDTGQLLGNSTSLLQAVALGDLDGDNDLDLFTASTQPNTIWLNDGTAVFSDTQQSLGNLASNSVALGDVDGDNDLDAVVANGWQFDNTQPSKLYLNDGAGVFTDTQDLAVGWHYDAALGDLDGDNDLDVVLSSWEGPGEVWLNQGGNQGGTPGQFSAAGNVGRVNGWRLDLADVDLDNDLDVMQAVNDNTGAGVWLNDGSGNFTEDSQALSADSQAVVLADFDADNDADVMFGRFGANEVWRNGDAEPTPTNTPTPTHTPTHTPTPTATPPTPTPAGAESWQRDIAASAGGSGFSPDLALDSNGRPHFAHLEANAGTINYAYWDGARWYRATVTDTTYSQAETFIAVDGQGQPHVLYQTKLSQWEYSRRSNGQWQPVTTLTAQTTADVILDGSDRLVVAYENDSSKLTVGRWLGGSWDAAQIDDRLLDEVEAALAAGSGDELHLAYLVPLPGLQVIYGYFDGSSWSTETVATLGEFTEPKEIDLMLDGSNQPVILYTFDDAGPDRLMRVTKNGATWNSEELFASGSDITAPSIAYDSQDQAHVLLRLNDRPYYDSEDGGWQFTALPGDESVAELSNLVLDGSDAPHFAFRDAKYANLNYQFFGPAWELHILEASDGARLPAVSHVQEEVGVSFYSLDHEQLRFLQRQPDAWQESPIADLAQPGADSSLRMSLGGQHTASYRDSANNRLMFGRFDGATWQTEIVDDFADVGYDNTLFMLPNSQLIVYWDGDNHRVKIAHNDGSGWTLFADDVGSPQNSSSGNPRAVLQGNSVYVTYYDGVNGDLRLAAFDLETKTWSDEMLVGGAGMAVSPYHDVTQVNGTRLLVVYYDEMAEQLVLGTRLASTETWTFDLVANGIPSIGGLDLEARSYSINGSLRLIYLDESANRAVLASRMDGTWSFETVRDGDNMLAEPSLGLGERPYLAFAAAGSDALELAVRVPTELQRGVLYNPYNPGDNGDNGNFLVDVCDALLDDDSQLLGGIRSWLQPAPATDVDDDYDTYAAMTALFQATAGGRHYTDLYLQHLEEVVAIGATDPLLLWDSYQTLQDFMPGLEALVAGEGDRVVVTQRMADNALDIWQRLAAAGSPALAQTINDELAATDNLQDFVGMTFDEWALAIGVEPPAEETLFLPLITR